MFGGACVPCTTKADQLRLWRAGGAGGTYAGQEDYMIAEAHENGINHRPHHRHNTSQDGVRQYRSSGATTGAAVKAIKRPGCRRQRRV